MLNEMCRKILTEAFGGPKYKTVKRQLRREVCLVLDSNNRAVKQENCVPRVCLVRPSLVVALPIRTIDTKSYDIMRGINKKDACNYATDWMSSFLNYRQLAEIDEEFMWGHTFKNQADFY